MATSESPWRHKIGFSETAAVRSPLDALGVYYGNCNISGQTLFNTSIGIEWYLVYTWYMSSIPPLSHKLGVWGIMVLTMLLLGLLER